MAINKCALVLEGGGLRGAYTAGALTWFIDNNIEFDYSYGISTGAIYLCNYLMKSKENLLYFSTDGIADKRYMYLPAILRSGKIVDYDYLFNHIMEEENHYDLSPLKDCKSNAYYGLYDLQLGKTVYYPIQEININLLKASTTLPILGKIVKENGRELFDGGITDMIPIERAIEDGCNKFVVIATKPQTYRRKPSKKFIVNLMRKTYSKYPKLYQDYEIRHINYEKQINLIKSLCDKKQAIYCCPSKESKVTRLDGSKEELKNLFDMGYQDMEDRKQELFSIIND